MKEGDDYCGFLCSDIIERQEKIVQDIKDFSAYNPEFALEMMGRITNLCVKGLNEGWSEIYQELQLNFHQLSRLKLSGVKP